MRTVRTNSRKPIRKYLPHNVLHCTGNSPTRCKKRGGEEFTTGCGLRCRRGRQRIACMRMRAHWVAVLLLVGCGSKSGGSNAAEGPCALRKGTYSITFHARSGDCGDLPEQIVVVNQTTIENAP